MSGRVAIHYEKGELLVDETIKIESILGSYFNVKVVETTQFGQYQAIIPQVSGMAYITGKSEFYIDPEIH